LLVRRGSHPRRNHTSRQPAKQPHASINGDQLPLPAATCSNPLGPRQATPDVPTPGAIDQHTAAGIAAAFNTYFGGIDTNYAAPYAVLRPRLQQTSSYRELLKATPQATTRTSRRST
jgi:hypothetical protein